MQNQSCFGGRLIVAPLVHLLLIPSTPMHLKLINNPLCYLTDHIIIRGVQLKSCHTLIKKCSFNFFEQCSFSPQAQGRAQLPLTQKGNQGTVVSPYPQEFLFFKTTLLQESHNSLCYRSGIPSLQLNKPQKCWDNWVFSVVSTLSQPPGT